MIYLFLADGFEETEALVPLDLLRRAGIGITTVGVNKKIISGAHGINVSTDVSSDQFVFCDCEGIILPGGMPGTENLFADSTVNSAVDYCIENNLLIGAICAAPVILGRRGLLKGKNAVCFPGFEDELIDANISTKPCCVDANIITAKGAGCVFHFAHSLIEYIADRAVADNIINQIQYFPLG